ncbi:permease prefix domain 1-containing protein [Actinoplanes sp. NPDC051851]|uniref:permease prefix domain 1-containing protein n=1 Tax=Actinoplanes sp. NPDC051851 TaxID=3154753 RepID=UPI00343C888F
MNHLVDRYVTTALRRIPEQQRTDIDRELRASIGDAVDARIESGEAPEAALESTLTELGDPARLADGYVGRPAYLIGPDLYFAWLRVLKMLYSIVLPVAVGLVTLIQILDDLNIGKVIAAIVTSTLTVGAHIAFWTTLAFAILERTGPHAPLQNTRAWSVDDLPRHEPPGLRTTELVAGATWSLLLIGGLVLQEFTFTAVPVLDPANWTFWWPFLIVVLLVRAAYPFAVRARGGWTRATSAGNAVLAVLVGAPLIWLLASDGFFNPGYQRIAELVDGHVKTWMTTTLIVSVVLSTLWDIGQVVVQAERNRRAVVS